MKLKHPTHDPKPMDALSYYLQVQREYALAREGYLRIDEAEVVSRFFRTLVCKLWHE